MSLEPTQAAPSNSSQHVSSEPSAQELRQLTAQSDNTVQPSTQPGGAQPQQPMQPLAQSTTGNATITPGSSGQAAQASQAGNGWPYFDILQSYLPIFTHQGIAEQLPLESERLRKELAAWRADADISGQKEDAARRIQHCFDSGETTLTLNQLHLTELPDCIGRLSHLTSLYLNDNQLTSLPESLWQLYGLKFLSLGKNRLTSLPESIGQLSHLTSLFLSDNQLTSLPESLWQLYRLKSLSLGKNRLSSISEGIGQLSRLQFLSLENNRLTSLPESMAQLSRLRKLSLSSNKLTHLPDRFGQLFELTHLFLTNNRLTSLPENIGHLSQLIMLHLVGNQLTTLPYRIGELYQLEVLRLSDNQLRYIPVTVGELDNLVRICVDNNCDLQELPLCLGQLFKLMEISAADTGVPSQQTHCILASCRAVRDEEAIEQRLAKKMDLWQSAANSDRAVGFQTLGDSEQGQIYQWLTRLEHASDLSEYQRQLANTVWNIMADLTMPEHSSLKDSFLNQLSGSLEDCQDHAAMTLNTLYTSWKLERNPSGSEQETLNVMAGLAKTLTLRDAVTDKINAMEKAGADVFESVQIYLYCETKLRDDLKLTTAIKNMTYAEYTEKAVLEPIKNRYGISIDLSELKKTVEHHYLETMVKLSKVVSLWETDKEAQQRFKQCSEGTRNEIKALDKKIEEQDELTAKGLLPENKLSEDDYHSQGTALRKTLEDIKSESIIDWIKKKF